MERATVRVTGIVQSVGFRPFVYRTAVDYGLRGLVRNEGDAGVHIELEGGADAIDAFLQALRTDAPPLATVETVDVDRTSVTDATFDTFDIVESEQSGGGGGTIPPDTAMCEACIEDMRDPDSRYHQYWATSCVDCGPRFTVIDDLPYDRPTTAMAAFPLCQDCRTEYEDPTDRRYHAQTIACPDCGPTLQYLDSAAIDDSPSPATDGRDPFPAPTAAAVPGSPAIEAAATTIADGGIVVLKGIGGAHLACDATDDAAVTRLRDRTDRPAKPFAVMAPDLDTAATVATVDRAERDHLTSPRRPILLLDARPDSPLAPPVAPGLHTVGVMLPYAGVHHLLFDHLDSPVVMTSANLPGQPMLVENNAIGSELAAVADGFLLHDRRIVARCDDSVARFVDGDRRLLRRSRGFVPTPVPGPDTTETILGLGPELDVTAALLADGECYLTQYLGDVDTLETQAFLEDAIDHLRSITGLDHPTVVAHDAHPAFNTTTLAKTLADHDTVTARIPVQHHHAHAASVLAEHDQDAAIAVTIDGVGYGPDGTIWGGEILDATRRDYDRVGGLAPVPMPGGDQATRHPARMLAGALADRYEPDALTNTLARHDVDFPGGAEERSVVAQQLDAGVNTPSTTSAGRFLDAVSALVGACSERRYEGEPAMKLEALAARGTPIDVDLRYDTIEGRRVLDTPWLCEHLLELADQAVPMADIAATAQAALARGLGRLAVEAADGADHDTVCVTGGVAYNEAISTRLRTTIEAAGLTVLGNESVPPGDGGISYGQTVVAAAHRPTD